MLTATIAFIALADDRGRLLTVGSSAGDSRWRTIVEASSHGRFAVSDVPFGVWELRVGTRAELERGEARARQRVVVGRAPGPPIAVRV